MKVIEFENDKNCENSSCQSISKELLGGLLGIKEKPIKYGSDDWKDYLSNEVYCFDKTIEEIENYLSEIDMTDDQFSKLSKLIDELTGFSLYITEGLMLGFDE